MPTSPQGPVMNRKTIRYMNGALPDGSPKKYINSVDIIHNMLMQEIISAIGLK